MKIISVSDYNACSLAAAHIVASVIAAKPDAAIIVPTGNSPVGMFRQLSQMRQNGLVDASQVRIFQLDNYLGLTDDDPRSLYRWMNVEFLEPMAIPPSHVVRLPGTGVDPAVACAAYEMAAKAAGGIDLSVLGLGPNGHLGFNEPPVMADAPTRPVTLTEESIASNAVYWGGRDRVPRLALTAGLNILLAARQTLLLVSGKHKRDILERTVRDAITQDVPATYLQQATNVTILADEAAWPHS